MIAALYARYSSDNQQELARHNVRVEYFGQSFDST